MRGIFNYTYADARALFTMHVIRNNTQVRDTVTSCRKILRFGEQHVPGKTIKDVE